MSSLAVKYVLATSRRCDSHSQNLLPENRLDSSRHHWLCAHAQRDRVCNIFPVNR